LKGMERQLKARREYINQTLLNAVKQSNNASNLSIDEQMQYVLNDLNTENISPPIKFNLCIDKDNASEIENVHRMQDQNDFDSDQTQMDSSSDDATTCSDTISLRQYQSQSNNKVKKVIQCTPVKPRVKVTRRFKGGQYKCPHCEYSTKWKGNLPKHVRIHNVKKNKENVRPFKCKIPGCNKAYKNQGHLNRHMLRHNGKKDFKCPHCEYATYDNSHLSRHVLTRHTKYEKPFKCEFGNGCSMSFRTTSELKQHMDRHLGIKPHKCPICRKAFVTKGELKLHIRTHTGEKPVECRYCKWRFTNSAGVRHHMIAHHPEELDKILKENETKKWQIGPKGSISGPQYDNFGSKIFD